MIKHSAPANEFAEKFRYTGDTLRTQSVGDETGTDRIRGQFFHDGLFLSPSVTPDLANRLDVVCKRLKIEDGAVEAFIYASPDIQAECFAGSSSKCIIRFSSSLIDLLDPEEFEFVVGHELAHFLLNHGIVRMEQQRRSIEFAIESRAQEISADRLGFVACQSLDIAIRALMKTVSGLSSEHLRFDVGAFVSQLQNAPEAIKMESRHASHPSILIRCRALLWFSMSELSNCNRDHFSKEEMLKIDKHIQRDMDKFIDGPAKLLIEEAKENLAIWVAANHAVQDGTFDKNEQSSIAEMFGDDVLEKLKGFISDIPHSEVQDTVFQRMKTAREELESLIPSGLEDTVREIHQKIESKFI
jgi:hypothetical protein